MARVLILEDTFFVNSSWTGIRTQLAHTPCCISSVGLRQGWRLKNILWHILIRDKVAVWYFNPFNMVSSWSVVVTMRTHWRASSILRPMVIMSRWRRPRIRRWMATSWLWPWSLSIVVSIAAAVATLTVTGRVRWGVTAGWWRIATRLVTLTITRLRSITLSITL